MLYAVTMGQTRILRFRENAYWRTRENIWNPLNKYIQITISNDLRSSSMNIYIKEWIKLKKCYSNYIL